ncbi:MAG TPA: methyl-accepting chemotaxis protein [Thermoanaerobaculia bacterium]|nr:methyl-accepting chemotaxis protein [Thermoanaerobaculia bacterium]
MIRNLKIGMKLGLIGLAFSIPIAILLFLVIRGLNKDIRFARKEKIGNQYQRPLEKLFRDVVSHRLLAQQASLGDTAAQGSLASIAEKVEGDFQEIERVDALYREDLETTDEGLAKRKRASFAPANLKREWNDIKTQPTGSSSSSRYDQVVADIRGLISHVGDTSNLILDPDLDSYYMMDVTLLALPQTQDRLQQVAIFASTLLQDTSRPIKSRMKLNSLDEMLRSDLEHINASSRTAVTEDPNFYGASPSLSQNLSPALEANGKLIEAFAAPVGEIAESETAKTTPDVPLTLGLQALDQDFRLWDIAVAELDTLLNKRIGSLVFQRTIGLGLSAIALSVWAVLFFIMRSITRPLEEAVVVLTQATDQADLTRRLRVTGTDEVGILSVNFNKFIENLERLIRLVVRSGDQVAASTSHIAAGSKELEATVAEQVAATNEVAVTAREISATSSDLAKTMNDVSRMAESTSELARQGQHDLQEMEGSMGRMEEASGAVSAKLAVINEKAGNISSVVTTITKVADQTNLLSLNAAIEAEKAGQYGQGFAVVAREIRRLADQTAVATLDIEKMVREMKTAVSSGVMSMDKFSDQVRKAVEAVRKVGLQLAAIIEQVQEVTPRFDAVRMGMETQSSSAQQISESMAQLSQTTQQTAQALAETNRSIEQLDEAARSLDEMSQRFKLTAA